MFLNTTTVPSTAGIHGDRYTITTNGYSFTIDKYIDTNGCADGVFVLKGRRFNTRDQFDISLESRGYSYVDEDFVYIGENINGYPSEEVYQYDSNKNEFNKVRELSKRVMNIELKT